MSIIKKPAPIHLPAIPSRMVLKGTAIVMVAPVMLLLILALYDRISLIDAVLGSAVLFVISVVFVRPYVANLSALTRYVELLAEDKKAMPPDLSFLNNVEELSKAVSRLQNSWEIRRNQLEGYLGESKILIDSLPNILIMLDEHFNIVQTNNTARSTFRAVGVNETLAAIINDPVIRETARSVLDTKEGQSVAYRLGEPISRDYMVRIERFPVFSPRGIALIVVMEDTTEIKQTEKTFADFVANASHEIRTPLTSIVGCIETLRNSAKDDPEAREKFLQLMEEQADRMTRLVKDLLSLSRIERNMTTRPTDAVAVPPLVEEIIRQVDWAAKEKNVTIKKKIEKNPPHVIGDREELGQVIYNFLNNAIKYGNKDSTITLKISTAKNKFPAEKMFDGVTSLLSVSVTDQGEGIPPEHLPRLTERFYRVDKARSRKEGGTGLGLSIVKHILDRHQGILTIESTLGEGSTFTAWLPVPEK